MKVSQFDYHLPPELIAHKPIEPRDTSRLLVLHKIDGMLEHKIFHDILDYFKAGDVVVLNYTRVLPARLLGVKSATGAKVEIFLLNSKEKDTWEVLARPAKRLPIGTEVIFAPGFSCIVKEDLGDGEKKVEFTYSGDFYGLLDTYGEVPLPPYIKAEIENKERYQTVYGQTRGSAAAPTAGLHFTEELLEKLKAKGVILARILLHVGLGTFRPVTTDEVEEHIMHSEFFSISQESADIITKAKQEKRRIIAVGTTSIRTLESAWLDNALQAGEGWTDIFIYPGYEFKVVDGMITNFHLPKSTLLMLVSALAGTENIVKAYQEAINQKYRFFSFGDAMLIL